MNYLFTSITLIRLSQLEPPSNIVFTPLLLMPFQKKKNHLAPFLLSRFFTQPVVSHWAHPKGLMHWPCMHACTRVCVRARGSVFFCAPTLGVKWASICLRGGPSRGGEVSWSSWASGARPPPKNLPGSMLIMLPSARCSGCGLTPVHFQVEPQSRPETRR